MQGHTQNTDLTEIYHMILKNQNMWEDISQLQAVEQLNIIYQYFRIRKQRRFFGFQGYQRPKGVYLWGEVGSGKTWLMDLFYDNLAIEQKIRIHFHHFLKDIHRRLIQLQGNQNPIARIANEMIATYQVICIDEFFIGNVADAMILGDLLQLLLKREMILVFTSNTAPSQLYKNGLNKDRIMPMIYSLEQHCTVIPVGIGKDYRRQSAYNGLKKFRYPLSCENTQWLTELYMQYSHGQPSLSQPLMINNRQLMVIKRNSNVLWCHFDALCRHARSPSDYIQMATEFSAFFIADIPPLNDKLQDPTRRLIYLVDELYDRKKHIIITAEKSLDQLYSGTALAFEFQRTQSRLYQMCG